MNKVQNQLFVARCNHNIMIHKKCIVVSQINVEMFGVLAKKKSIVLCEHLNI